MKKLSIIIALLLCLSLCSCGDNSKKAFEYSKDAFDYTTKAYIATNAFSNDIYEAWYLGVNNRTNYDENYEFSSFVDKMSIDRDYIEQAVANLLGNDSYSYGDWEALPELYNNSYFSAWVSVISEAYKCSGEVDVIEKRLNNAMDLMKKLDNKYSDYVHYPVLKEYFTNTIAFLEFCRNPEGSFEQVVTTFNTYRNTARECFFDLNYVFNNSIAGMEPDNSNADTEEHESY